MNLHAPTPSLVPHICTCGARDSDPTWHRVPVAQTVSPKREPDGHLMDGTPLYPVIDVDREPVAVARRTDPSTSWEAARSVTGIRKSQLDVLDTFRYGPMTDEEAWSVYEGIPHRRRQSVSGFRTRRAELVKARLIEDSGERRVGSTGRRMIVWKAA